jgi:hypothetical protein
MASTTPDTETYVQQIGTTAGVVWQALSDNGPVSFAKLVKLVGAPRDVVMQAVGWLAREGKVSIDDSRRGRIIGLA